MEEPKNAKLFLALKSRYALHNTDRLVEFILDDQKTSFDFITEIIPQIEEENKKAPKLFKVTVDTDILERLRAKQTCKGKYPLNDAYDSLGKLMELLEIVIDTYNKFL